MTFLFIYDEPIVLFYGKSRINLELVKALECNRKMIEKRVKNSNSLSSLADASHQIYRDSEEKM